MRNPRSLEALQQYPQIGQTYTLTGIVSGETIYHAGTGAQKKVTVTVQCVLHHLWQNTDYRELSLKFREMKACFVDLERPQGNV